MSSPALRPLKILLVHERFPPDYAGGGEYVVLETARHLQARGHTVKVLTVGDPAVTAHQGIATERMAISRYRMNFVWREFARAAQDVDLIQCFTYHSAYPACKAGRALGKPVVMGVLALFGDVWLEMRGPLIGRGFRALERFLLRQPTAANIYLSEESHALAAQFGCAKASDVIIPPGISVQDYGPAANKDCVMYAGKLDVRKGIETVLSAAERLPDIPFRLIGWGERYDEIAARCPPNVRIEPFQDRLHLAHALGQARIFVFPSKAETFGLIVAEAMASGCAVVSTSPLPFAGARIEPDDPAATSAAVRALWQDDARCAAAAAQNIATAQTYTWERHVAQLEAVYFRALGLPL